MMKVAMVIGLLAAPMIFAADAKEEPVGLVMSPGGAKLLRANTETPLDARSGDLLFTGDGLRTEAGPASFLYCPEKSLQTLGPSGEIHFDPKTAHVKTGKITGQKPVQACFLPQVVRLAVASQQHYGVSMTRGLDKPDMPAVSTRQNAPGGDSGTRAHRRRPRGRPQRFLGPGRHGGRLRKRQSAGERAGAV